MRLMRLSLSPDHNPNPKSRPLTMGRPAFPAFTCVSLSYFSPGSLAVTVVAMCGASCPFDCDYSHLPFIFASAKFSACPLVIRRGVQRVRHHVLKRCLEPSSLSARPFGVGFHSNRPSIDPSVGFPPSLRGHSTGALSLFIPAKPRLRSLRNGTDINLQSRSQSPHAFWLAPRNGN